MGWVSEGEWPSLKGMVRNMFEDRVKSWLPSCFMASVLRMVALGAVLHGVGDDVGVSLSGMYLQIPVSIRFVLAFVVSMVVMSLYGFRQDGPRLLFRHFR